MTPDFYTKKQVVYPKPFIRICSMILDLSLITLIISPVMQYVSLFLFRYIFANEINLVGMSINSLEDIKLLFTSDTFVENLKASYFFTFLMSSIAIEYFLISFYFIFCWVYFGSTIGKMFFKMKVLDLKTHQKLSISMATLRYLGYALSLFSVFTMPYSQKKRAVHDYVSGAVVIKS
ncbi:MAG: RDD family protein [Rickettsiaceae bacterium]|nr:RDD family protein [Rickettsiaceae bacterium]